ncbi:MAG: nuclear transport factor 2 family protein [Betaproteobacteria bacterium]|nr:nuclear transport factor 2 family protein [Betaproteobacteria bacterium]
MQVPVLAMAAEMETARKIYVEINRNDIPAALAFFDPEAVRVEPAGFPSAGTYRGHAAILAHISAGRGTWAEGTCEPEQLIAAGDKVVVFLHVHVRLHGHTDWIDGRFADVCTFRDGKVIEFRTFGERQDALDWAGAKAPDAA